MTGAALATDAAALAARVLRSAPTVGDVRLVCVDGPAGSGKTTLAAALVHELELVVGAVPVVHGDEVYEGWPVVADAPDRLTAFALLGARVTGWLIEPWGRGEPGTHPRWDWYAGSWGAPRTVPPAPVAILEGVGLASSPLRLHATLSVWVEAPASVRLARVLTRDGEPLRDPMRTWQADELAWFAHDATRHNCTLRLTT